MTGSQHDATMRLPTLFIGYGQFGWEVLSRLNETVLAHAPSPLWEGLGPVWRFLSVQRSPAGSPDLHLRLETVALEPEAAAGQDRDLILDRVLGDVQDVLAEVPDAGDLRLSRVPGALCLLHVADLADPHWGPQTADLICTAHEAVEQHTRLHGLLSVAVVNAAAADPESGSRALANLDALVRQLANSGISRSPLIYLISSLTEDGAMLPRAASAPVDLAVSYLEALTLARLFDQPAEDADYNLDARLDFYRTKGNVTRSGPDAGHRAYPCLAAFGVRLSELPTARLRQLCTQASFAGLAEELAAERQEELPKPATSTEKRLPEPPLQGASLSWQSPGLSIFDTPARLHEKVDQAMRQWEAVADRLLEQLRPKILPGLWQRARALEIAEARTVREKTFGPDGSCADLARRQNAVRVLGDFLRSYVKTQEGISAKGLKGVAWEELGDFDLRRVMAEPERRTHEQIERLPPLLARGLYLAVLLVLALAFAVPLLARIGDWRISLGVYVGLPLACALLFLYEALRLAARLRRLEVELTTARDAGFVQPLEARLRRVQVQAGQHWRARLASVLADQGRAALAHADAHRVILEDQQRRYTEEHRAETSRRASGAEISLTRKSLLPRWKLHEEAFERRLSPAETRPALEEDGAVGWQGWLWTDDLLAPWRAVERRIGDAVAEKWPDDVLVRELKLPTDLVERAISEGRPRQTVRLPSLGEEPSPRPDRLDYWIAIRRGEIPDDTHERLDLKATQRLTLVRTDHSTAVYLWTATRNLTLDTVLLQGA